MYYVFFGFNKTNPLYVYLWAGPNIESYTLGQTVHGGDFDIADIKLSTPANGATMTLPATFSWQPRGLATDTYRIIWVDPDDSSQWWFADAGSSASFTTHWFSPEITYGKEYAWYVEIYNGSNSLGKSYEARGVTFAAGLASGQRETSAVGTGARRAAPSRPGTFVDMQLGR